MPADVPGLLLVNLGTPEAPRTPEVRRYLREFLSDPRVLDMAAPLRFALLNAVILPFRPKVSAEAYAKIWTAEGSPLLVHSRALAEKVGARLAGRVVVKLAMRYGTPSIAQAMDEFYREGVRRIVVFPLYPQATSAATGSSVERVFREAAARWNVPAIHVVPPFFDHPLYLDCVAATARAHLAEVDPEVVFWSFHGLPESQIRKSDRRGGWCLASGDCCERAPEQNPDAFADCYRAQCVATARALAARLAVPETKSVVCFQSRLSQRWIRPFTDVEVVEAAKRGARRAVVFSPAFVADCLETLEEIGIRAAADWRKHGGETLRLVPSLNARDDWADAVVTIASQASAWLPGGRA